MSEGSIEPDVAEEIRKVNNKLMRLLIRKFLKLAQDGTEEGEIVEAIENVGVSIEKESVAPSVDLTNMTWAAKKKASFKTIPKSPTAKEQDLVSQGNEWWIYVLSTRMLQTSFAEEEEEEEEAKLAKSKLADKRN
ncbi:hypothetical protein L1987_63587 [Smallanthus sonchifolius]|uniref:Uncharacterized protein n=1 Tax=Smallanthus sonchifolius TaxID=185202 RepID=A0ACB9CDN8_9ASTR|nr:hypothetical protein L1987_63587 [Smallanthus sonchifolius]